MDNPLSVLQNAYWGNNPDEAHILEYLKPLLPQYSCFVDVGASLGQYTKLVAEYMEKGFIIAYEPDKVRFNGLVANVMVWRTQFHVPIYTFRWAISSENKQGTFHTSQDSHSGSLSKNQYHSQKQDNTITVPLDNMQLPSNSLIKVDVEGTEVDVLKGATRILKDKLADWLIECHHFDKNTKPEVLEIMKSVGYGATKLDSNHFFFEVNNEP